MASKKANDVVYILSFETVAQIQASLGDESGADASKQDHCSWCGTVAEPEAEFS
jgi:hypothetical protein